LQASSPKSASRVVSEIEFAEAWANISRIWKGLDEDATGELRTLLRRYLGGEFSIGEWSEILRSIAEWRGLAAG
jgi:hypothetical protein